VPVSTPRRNRRKRIQRDSRRCKRRCKRRVSLSVAAATLSKTLVSERARTKKLEKERVLLAPELSLVKFT
jgi:hypothetical protein